MNQDIEHMVSRGIHAENWPQHISIELYQGPEKGTAKESPIGKIDDKYVIV